MALTSTLYTGLSGMTVNQQRLNVTGNNIANANTVAFKSSRALIEPEFYVTDSAGSSPTTDSGGVNPSQRGLGAEVASIQKDFTQGSLESTGVPTDMAIDGDGFFVVHSKGDTSYTRDGSFTLNENNELVSSTGQFVQGYGVDKDFAIVPGKLQNLTIPVGSLTIAEQTSNVSLKGNLNADGEVATGASVLQTPALLAADGTSPTDATALTDLRVAGSTTAMFTDGQTLTVDGKRGTNQLGASTLKIDATTSVADLNTFLQGGLGIDTAADVVAAAPAGYAPGVGLSTTTATGDPAGSLRLTITGNSGKANALSLAGDALTTSAGTVPLVFSDATNSSPTGESQHTTMTVYDSLGTPVQADVTMALESKTDTGTTWRYYATSKDNATTGTAGIVLGSGTVSFDNNGVYKGVTNNAVTIGRNDTGAIDPMSVKMDFTSMTSLTDQSSSFTLDSQDGFETGSISNFSVADNGEIVGTFSNGLKRTLGQVAVATFDNKEGLIDQGGNNYAIGPGSGEAVVSAPGSFGSGAIRAGSLEQSNVDLSKEFLNMIVSSTGFSAASRVISTSNQLLDQLLQTAR